MVQLIHLMMQQLVVDSVLVKQRYFVHGVEITTVLEQVTNKKNMTSYKLVIFFDKILLVFII